MVGRFAYAFVTRVLASLVLPTLTGCGEARTEPNPEKVVGAAECHADEGGAPRPEVMEPPAGCEETSTPTFNLAEGGCVSASHPGVEGAESAARLFDDNSGTKWVTANPTPWIAYEFAAEDAHAVVSYTVTSAGDHDDGTADPTAWELQGSMDGPEADPLTWTTLDVQEGQVFDVRYRRHAYALTNADAYHRYRFLVTANGGAPTFRAAEIELFAEGTPVFSIDTGVTGAGDNQFMFSNGWSGTHDPTSERHDGTSSWSNTVGEYFTLSFVGSQIRLFGVTDPHHGIIGVSLDGGDEVSVDLYGSTTEYNQLVYTSPKLCPGAHTLRGRVTGEKNPASTDVYVSLDRAQVVP